MKLKECIRIGIECGLSTLGEAFDNIRMHSTSLFEFSKINEEMRELCNDIGRTHNLKVIDSNIDNIKIKEIK